MTDTERRFTKGLVEVRAAGGTESRTIGGYAAKFNKYSQNLGGFVEKIAPSAFNRARGNDWPDVIARYNHDDAFVLGTTPQTLRLNVDEVGLVYEADLPNARADVYELIQRGDVSKSSFAFRVSREDGEEWGINDQNFPVRTLLSVELHDVAPVNAPAYLDTSTALRSLAKHMDADVEEVRSLAAEGELRKFFMRTDRDGKPAPKHDFGAAARMQLLGRKSDPWA